MAGLITEQELRDRFDISKDVGQKRLTPALAAASKRIRGWVGDEAYDDALKNGPTEAHPEDPAPEDADRKEILTNAEAHVAMSYALVGLNTALRTQGMIKGERSGQGDIITSYFGPDEVAAYQQVYLDTAEQIAAQYILNAGEPSPLMAGAAGRTEGATVTW